MYKQNEMADKQSVIQYIIMSYNDIIIMNII